MKSLINSVAVFFVLLLVVFASYILESPSAKGNEEVSIDHWQVVWTDEFDPSMSQSELDALSGWELISLKNSSKFKPRYESSQWIRIELPDSDFKVPALLFEKIYGSHVIVKIGDKIIYEANRNFNYKINTALVPVNPGLANNTLYVGLESESRIGIQDQIRFGEYDRLQNEFIKGNITDFILGSAMIFIAAVMLVCSLFLKSGNMTSWLSLCFVILACGLIVVTYSPVLYSMYGDYGKLYVTFFDLALFLLLPSFTYFFESIFGVGYRSIIRKYRIFQVFYSFFCLVLMVLNELTRYKYYSVYSFLSVNLLGIIMIVQFLLLTVTAVIYSVRGNRDAIIFTTGLTIFATLGLAELFWFYVEQSYYDLYLWKWGVVCFLLALIIILGRKFARNHEQVVEYSKQLEMFNNELQRSEKMEIISELAASVAHEVRNPLQVTRGFLQLLAEKQQNSEKVYLNMALEELDRASGIITDFLTFAKPEAGKVTNLNVLDEFIHIEGILIPLANLQGGKITVHIPKNLYVKGNSSKFKQAFINIIKNSIESLRGEGEIQIWAYEEDEQVFIHIKDNGEGMDADVLSRLGEPYFSNKTKGTGLGLMVTFRIIEVMMGKISFSSEKGVGTEAVITFASAGVPEDNKNEPACPLPTP
ncbi:ATP-binding protein [Paenibacillus macerans]|uniref:ATP-binding protein n=1 Tax=Paenibacillus macerans TaxID=44252 RepID=UPI003D320D1C